MVTEQWMTDEVKKIIPDAEVEISDLHGTGDHFLVRIISNFFEGYFRDKNQYLIISNLTWLIIQFMPWT